MKKSIAFAAIAIVATSGIFAQSNSSDKSGKIPLPPEVKLPDASVVKEYHNSQMNALKILKDAQIKAGICNQEQADAAIAILRAVQSECKGQCILSRSTDIPFGAPCHHKPIGDPRRCEPMQGKHKNKDLDPHHRQKTPMPPIN